VTVDVEGVAVDQHREVATPGPEMGEGTNSLATDVLQAVRNASTLGLSLLGTWAIALVVRIFLPRHLGPAAFGDFQFADSFTVTAFVLTGLGIETYVRKEVSTRSEHATDFFGGTALARFAISGLVMAAAMFGLALSGKPVAIRHLVFLLGIAQVLVTLNLTYGALLHAVGRVGGLSILNVVTKLLWGGGILIAFTLGGGVISVAAAMLASEAVRTAGLAVLTRRHMGLQFRVNLVATRRVVTEALPYYLATLAMTIYSRIDVSIMAYQTTSEEVGWYGAASTLAGMAMLVSPLIGWVILPLSSRAAARSREELRAVSRRAMELVLSASLPLSLFMYLASEVIVRTLFGAAYAPAVTSMRIQAPVFVLTYVTIVSGSLLVRVERGWAVTWISVAGMVASPLLNVVLIPMGLRHVGRGGAGAGAATALVITELATSVAMTWLLRGLAFDKRGVTAVSKTVVVCLAVVALDQLLMPLGPARLLLDGAAYLVGVVAWQALDVRGATAFLRIARSLTIHAEP
jgi:O-antigen/teichoic acid export membrane protein